MNFTGVYNFEKSDNLHKYMVSIGLDDKAAKEYEAAKLPLEIVQNGDNFKFIVPTGGDPIISNFIKDQEVEDPSPFGITYMTTITVEGNTLTVVAKCPDDNQLRRTYHLNGSELLVTLMSSYSGIISKVTYKKQ